jgi:hypothetical protein
MTVAFHDNVRQTLNVILIKGQGSTADVAVDVPGFTGDGEWRMTDGSGNYRDMGTVSVGETFTPTAMSVSTVYWTGYDPDISSATYPITGGPTSESFGREREPRRGSRPAGAIHGVCLYDLSGRVVRGAAGGEQVRPLVRVVTDRVGGIVESRMVVGEAGMLE